MNLGVDFATPSYSKKKKKLRFLIFSPRKAVKVHHSMKKLLE